MSNNSPNALNYLETHKRLSQRIAIAQLRGENLRSDEEITQFLINERILSEEEAKFFNFVTTLETDTNKPSKVIDLRDFTFNIFGVSNQHLADLLSLGNLAPNDKIPYPLIKFINGIIAFIGSDSNQPPWSLVETESDVFLSPTKGEIEKELAPLATKVKENGSPFNVLQPSKKLSQLIAKSWLRDGDSEAKDVFTEGDPDKVKSFLKDRGLLSELDAEYATIKIDRCELTPEPNSTGVVYIGELTIAKDDAGEFTNYNITIPYPEEPAELRNHPEILEEWVNSPDGEELYTPVKISPVQISRWIPLTC
ncbi:MAG: hypothetical protein RM049_37030 [Nostoc sp. DedQUE04]|uniref:hypothetical protein n=1 Tax=Nostoc sp. DedQUE04 TaxID=3075390 RepID=UPI002AD48070|nr:hypothetical protein [Nostoc sp. DedQUE04]MDZ8140833.1 hypothetical protein [Nostoc sp. DedQUE04]